MSELHFGKFGADYELWDADHDTGIQVEKTADDDTLRWFLGGTTPIDALIMNQTNGLIWNEASDALKFRFEGGGTDANLIYHDGVNDGVSFGTSTTSITINDISVTAKVLVDRGGGNANINFINLSNSDTSTAGAFMVGARARGFGTSPTTYQAVQSGDRGLVFRNDCHDGTQFITSGQFQFSVNSAPSTGIIPTNFSLFLMDTAGSQTQRFLIDPDGRFHFTSPSGDGCVAHPEGGLVVNQSAGSDALSDFRVESVTYANMFRVDASTNKVNIGNATQGAIAAFDNTEIVFFEDSVARNFRVESDSNTHMLYVQGVTNRAGINQASPTSTFHINGSFATAYVAKTTTYTLTESDGTVNCTSGTFTATLPTAVGCTGRIYTVKNSGTGLITVATTSSQTIDGVTTQTLIQYASIMVQSNGASWIITSRI